MHDVEVFISKSNKLKSFWSVKSVFMFFFKGPRVATLKKIN